MSLQNYYRLATSTYCLQFVLLTIGTFNGATAKTDTLYNICIGLGIALFKGIPWLVLIPGLISKSKNVMAWMSYICLVYFIVWMLVAFGENHATLGTIGVFLTLAQFVAAAMYTRMEKRQ